VMPLKPSSESIQATEPGIPLLRSPDVGLLDAAEALRLAEAARKARGLVARLRAAWRGE
jgi:hypothetical protein